MLKIENMTTRFRKKTILHDITCNFEPGIHGLLGPNGAGKTTFMRTTIGLYPSAIRHVVLNGTSIRSADIGYLPQKFGLFPGMTVRECMRYIALSKELSSENLESDIEAIIDNVNLTNYIDTKASALSGGMIRRVGIAQAFLGRPALIMCDEPTSGLDPEERLRFRNLIKQIKCNNQVIIISTHIVDDVDFLCDYIEIMNHGRIIAQNTTENIKSAALGKVYETEDTNLSNLDPNSYFITSQYNNNGKNMTRLLSYDVADIPKLVPIEPTLEDGYMYLLKFNKNGAHL